MQYPSPSSRRKCGNLPVASRYREEEGGGHIVSRDFDLGFSTSIESPVIVEFGASAWTWTQKKRNPQQALVAFRPATTRRVGPVSFSSVPQLPVWPDDFALLSPDFEALWPEERLIWSGPRDGRSSQACLGECSDG